MQTDQTQKIPISYLQPNPFQPRSQVKSEEIQELVQSIRTFGVLEPLVVAHTPAGYQIIAGERRWRAAKEAGLTEVPVVIKKTSPKGMLEMALVENVQRHDLTPLERAKAFKQLMTDFILTAAHIANRIGKSPSYVSNTLKLLDLPDAVKDGLVGNLITEGHARTIGSLSDEKKQIECYKIILKEGASVRRAEELVRKFREQEAHAATPGKNLHLVSEEVEEWQKKLSQIFSNKAKVKLTRSQRQTRLSIVLLGDPSRTQTDLDKILTLISQENFQD